MRSLRILIMSELTARARARRLRAIWHGDVVAAAGAHWAAVLIGVVLATSR